ncbi:hypothetical protein [Clostridium magnum]|uniref:hypothetical protein n=1 Tax=Clostridium magnum TaxID=33954 RepID=UPI0009221384|nr:hypothetical protein [Clostridium magnum]SHJ14476.1 hypothetical protein SAMN02745944_05441 [Clostridium magnum DSM 2767]
MKKPPVDMNDYDMDEIEYTQEEEAAVIAELDIDVMMGKLELRITRQKLKSWFGRIQIIKPGEFCPNITGNDLVNIARRRGFEIE